MGITNVLITGEISAVETYSIAVDKSLSEPAVGPLRQIQAEHKKHAEQLTSIVLSAGSTPSMSSGAWGHIVTLIDNSAALIGESSAVSALVVGEILGRDLYRDHLGRDNFSPEVAQLIKKTNLPSIDRNLAALEAIKESS